MIIYSKPGAAIFYKVDVPEIPSDYWIPQTKVLEAETIATATTKAAIFRQIVKYDVSSIKASYSTIIDNTRALVILAMLADALQTSWYLSIGSSVYEVTMIASMVPLGRQKTTVSFQFAAIEKVS